MNNELHDILNNTVWAPSVVDRTECHFQFRATNEIVIYTCRLVNPERNFYVCNFPEYGVKEFCAIIDTY